MRIPKSLDIMGFTYHVRPMDDVTREEQEAVGLCDRVNQIIYLHRDSMSAQAYVETFLHEIIHAIYFEMGVEEDEGEEPTVTALSRGLFQVLQANPKLGKLFTRKWSEHEGG